MSVNTGKTYYVDTVSGFASTITNGNLTAPVGAGVFEVVEGNYVHDLRVGAGSHNESATIRGFNGTSLTFRNNRLISHTGSDSGALFITPQFLPIYNAVVPQP